MRRSRSPYSLWSRLWSRRARSLGRRNSDVAGAVERPHPGQRFVHGFELRGWLAPGGTVHVTANGYAVSTLEADRPRPDLAASVPGEVHGFEAWIRPGQLPSGRWLWLRVYGTPPHRPDEPRALIHAFPLRRGAGRALPRWAYGRVWDAAASDVGEARIAVAGFETDDEWHRSGESTAANVVARTGITTDDDVLEIGCGAGRVGDKIAPRCRRWIGADVSQRMIDYARAALAGHGNVAFVHLNGFDLDGIADASVDIVYCSAVFMHLDEWDRYRYVQEAMRVLRPGGRVYVDNFDLESPQGWNLFEEMARLDVAERPPNVSRASTRQELLCYLERVGFEDRVCETGALWVTVVGRKPSPA